MTYRFCQLQEVIFSKTDFPEMAQEPFSAEFMNSALEKYIFNFETMKATGFVSVKESFYDKIGALLMDHHFHVSKIARSFQC